MEVTLLEVEGDKGLLELPLRVRIGGSEKYAQFKVGRPVLLPYPPSSRWPASPNVSSSGGTEEEPTPVEVSLYEETGSQVLAALPGGGVLDELTPLQSFCSIPVHRRDGAASSLDLQIKRGGLHPRSGRSPTGKVSAEERRDRHMQRVQMLVQDVLRDRPKDPCLYMLEQLRRLQAASPKARRPPLPKAEELTAEGDRWAPTRSPARSPVPFDSEVRICSKGSGAAANASILNALTPLSTKRDGICGGKAAGPRPPDSPRHGRNNGRSFMHGIATRIFGGSSSGSSGEGAGSGEGPSSPTSVMASVSEGTERSLSQVQTEARFSLSLILRGPACSAAAESSIKQKVQNEIAERLTTLSIQAVRERLVAEAEAGIQPQRSRPPTALRNRGSGSTRAVQPPLDEHVQSLPTPIVMLNHSSNWSGWLAQ